MDSSKMSHVSSPLIRGGGGRLSPPLPSPRVIRCRRMTLRLRVDIYVHSGINKGGTQKKHFFLVWASREGHNEQTLSFSTEYSKNHLVKIMFF